jgi:hypothetical protein
MTMGYGAKDLNDRRDEALKIAIEHGFTDASIGEDVALFHSEASELLEDHRDKQSPTYLVRGEGAGVRCFWRSHLAIWVDGKRAFVSVRHDKQVFVDGKPTRKPCGIPSECADIIIRVLHFCGKHDIDIEAAVRDKLHYNETRPFKHGNKAL